MTAAGRLSAVADGSRSCCEGAGGGSLGPAITCRWTSQQNFNSRLVLEDRFTAANSELALAQPGQELSLATRCG